MTDSLLEIPGYNVIRRIGKGGMAEVYLATQESLRREVAVKVLHSAHDEAFNSRFIKEAHILASLHHPSIITIHDIDRLPDGRFYLAMEYVPGGDLSQYKGQVFEPERALAIVRQIASGLAVVHDKGLVHRDIKPANILFHEDGNVVITDFGVAKQIDLDSELTHSGIAVGSPAYSSPEQAQCEPLDARTDIYSLGVTLLEMLTGSNPFRGVSYTESVMKHVQMEVPLLADPLSAWQPVLERMLAKAPQERFADCHELLAALDALEEDADDTHVGPHHLANGARRRRPAVWLGALVCVVALVAVAVAFISINLQQRMQVVDLLVLGEQRLVEGRLVLPTNDNADYFFRQALLHDPDNVRAIDGLNKVLEARIETYLRLAEERFSEDQLLIPEEDGAVYYFRQVLGWAPDDARALDGLQRVAGRYLAMSERAYGRGNFSAALKYLERGLEVQPQHAELLSQYEQHEQRVASAQLARRSAPVAQRSRDGSASTVSAAQPSNPVKRLWSRIFD